MLQDVIEDGQLFVNIGSVTVQALPRMSASSFSQVIDISPFSSSNSLSSGSLPIVIVVVAVSASVLLLLAAVLIYRKKKSHGSIKPNTASISR